MNEAQSQAAALRFLGDPATYGDHQVRRIDTHANVIFLAGDRALKVKRAVHLPFLDYSSLAKRKAACASELEVNRAFAPELYRRVVPITRDLSGQLALDGDGETVEWAVEMLRFDESQTFDRIADVRGIDDALARKLAETIVDMHAHMPVVDANSWIAALDRFLEQNAAAFRGAPALFAPDLAAKLDHVARVTFERLRPLLISRGRRGLIHRGHGDLHLGNIALLDGRPVPFDAIEFDPDVAAGDILYDLAFLLMDLLERGFGRAANIVMNGYFARLARAEDLDGLAALPFFLSLRAAIRAKVTAARLQYIAPKDQASISAAAKAYFRLAMELLSPAPPTLIAIGGLSGTGKSSLARELAPHIAPAPGALLLRSDVERKRLFGIAETERLPPDAYNAEANARVYGIVADKAALVLAANHSVIVDAVFAKSDERAAVEAIAASAKSAFRGLFLVADLQTRLDRVGTRGLDASDANATVAVQQESFALGSIDWAEIDASGTLAQTLERARAAICSERWGPASSAC
jgi:aminoglycoside phosphotransferase family enzyme/predicted kinase